MILGLEGPVEEECPSFSGTDGGWAETVAVRGGDLAMLEISMSGFDGTRVRDAVVLFEAELPGLRGATSLESGASSESSLESDEDEESARFNGTDIFLTFEGAGAVQELSTRQRQPRNA